MKVMRVEQKVWIKCDKRRVRICKDTPIEFLATTIMELSEILALD